MKVKEQKILFILLLISSTLLHLGVISYSSYKGTTLLSAPVSQAPISMKISIQKPGAMSKITQTIKKGIKTLPKKKPVNSLNEAKKMNSEEKISTQESAPSMPQMTTRKFDTIIDHYTQPRYPRLAIRRGLTGVVTLTLWIKGDGQIDRVELTKSSGHKSLDESALLAVKEWRFKNLSTQLEKTALFRVEKRIVYQLD